MSQITLAENPFQHFRRIAASVIGDNPSQAGEQPGQFLFVTRQLGRKAPPVDFGQAIPHKRLQPAPLRIDRRQLFGQVAQNFGLRRAPGCLIRLRQPLQIQMQRPNQIALLAAQPLDLEQLLPLQVLGSLMKRLAVIQLPPVIFGQAIGFQAHPPPDERLAACLTTGFNFIQQTVQNEFFHCRYSKSLGSNALTCVSRRTRVTHRFRSTSGAMSAMLSVGAAIITCKPTSSSRRMLS